MPIHDLRCKRCKRVELDVVVGDRPYPECKCGGERDWIPARISSPEWGGPRFIKGIDKEFSSRSELRSYLKRNDFLEAGDKIGGARNEDGYKNAKYSYHGQEKR